MEIGMGGEASRLSHCPEATFTSSPSLFLPNAFLGISFALSYSYLDSLPGSPFYVADRAMNDQKERTMSKQQEMDRGYPQSDPAATSPPKNVPWLAIVLVSLGLLAVLGVLVPAMAFFAGN